MKKYSLQAKLRTVVGRKVKNLRSGGEIPATIYGKDIKSESVTVTADSFKKVFSEAGETGLIELSLDGVVRPVLINTVQKDPVAGQILHVEFRQVNLKQKVKTNVPLEFVGEAPAVLQKIGVVLTLNDEVEVEALPTDLPEKIEVNVSTLEKVDDEIKVSDLKAPPGVTILTAPELGVVRVGSLISKEAEAQAAQEAAAAAAAATAEAPAGEAATEESQKESSEVKPEEPQKEEKSA